MALIALTSYITPTNNKADMLERTLISLMNTVNWDRHSLLVVDNSGTQAARKIVEKYQIASYHPQETNLGTAEGINKAWRYRTQGQHCVKMDDDVVIHGHGWADLMEEAIQRDPTIGIIGLKRKDCWEHPEHKEAHLRSKLSFVTPEAGKRWIVIEEAQHIMGTCQMYNSALLDKIGYLMQPSLYGHDDVWASWRSYIAGFKNVFLPQYEIDHIDPGDTDYQKWKENISGKDSLTQMKQVWKWQNGEESIYYNPFE